MTALRSRLNGTVANLSPQVVTTKVWRGLLTVDELTNAGFAEAADEWELIKGLLKLKGLPEECLAEGVPVRADMTDDGLLIEFGGAPAPKSKPS